MFLLLLLLFFNGFFSWSLGEVKEMESLLSCCLGAAGGWFKGFTVLSLCCKSGDVKVSFTFRKKKCLVLSY